ncbi:type I restriction enzyme R subunit [Vreelandella songnenensis]|uniref:Type I restriction enzyme endonuclease subunit n=1 Tax=Vreelandella songnenensis TaxID=1176243 RepID=A0A2T0V3R1_9GAMM|nr:type I restriction endonuclease subunit R [Halomonas songnenensis]PRY64802.1 type I restriction enzyme R subunit [Halomonas songnenensis]
MGPEWQLSEQPLIAQLQAMGWSYIKGSLSDPAVTGRASFTEVVQHKVLRERLRAINTRLLDDGTRAEWLNEERISTAVSALTRIAAPGLMEANRIATERLTEGVVVDGLVDWDGGRSRTIHYIDWATPANNHFTVINQYKVACPPGHDTAKQHVVPDLVLLVNGIPLVVIECKSPNAAEPMAEAIDQLRRYSDQRFVSGEVGDHEGAPALFNTNQLLLATCFDDCRVGTIGASASHYLPWKAVASADNPHQREAEVAKTLGVTALSAQQRTVAGVLAPGTLLDIVRHFTLFTTSGGQAIKLVCRYQQYRGVVKAIDRLRHGKTRQNDGEHDRRGGIIWHTQGSGKSLTMMFLVRRMRTDPALRRFKVVVVTDRTDLQKQLSATAALSGDLVHVANNAAQLKTMLRQQGPGLVFAMIQKYRDAEGKAAASEFERLNTSGDILVMVDEAHRTQAGDLHANLQAGLPNAARIGFTGTPIIMGEKKRTHEIFGEFIDKYTIRESEADGATVPVLYEGRTAAGAVKEGSSLDELFEDFFADRSAEELEAIKQKYATRGHVLEAQQLIDDKARDMLRHYVTYILPNGYKAQVVGYSRVAAVRYKAAFEGARDELLADAERLSAEHKALDDEALTHKSPKLQARIQAWRYRELLARLEFATIVSGSNNDGAEWQPHTDRARQDEAIARFKKPLLAKEGDEARTDPLAFLIVKSMLLTGFDAPIEGVMYLDRSMQEAELLQTVARVNRTDFGKKVGIVVDYYGVANHLKEALAAYSDEDIDGALRSLKDEIPALRDRHLRAVDVLRSRGIEDLNDVETCVQALDSERVRQEFGVKLKTFMQSLDTVLPRPEALPFTSDAKALAMIYAQARRRYRDSTVLGKDVGAKVRRLIDEHVISLGIDPKIAPVNLTDAQFGQQLDQVREQAASYGVDSAETIEKANKAVASEMEHAIRSQVSEKLDEDPVYYGKLSERLKEILDGLAGQWDALITALQTIIDEVNSGSTRHEEGLPEVPETYLPFYRMLREVKCGDTPPDLATQSELIQLTEYLVEHISHEVKTPSFWEPHRRPMQEALEQALFERIYESELLEFEQIPPLVDKLRDLARANSYKLEQP